MSKKIHILHSNDSCEDNFRKNTNVGSLTNFNYTFNEFVELQLDDSGIYAAAQMQRLNRADRVFRKKDSVELETSNLYQTTAVNFHLPAQNVSSDTIFVPQTIPNIRSRNILRFLFTIIYGSDGTSSQSPLENKIHTPIRNFQFLLTNLRPLVKTSQNIFRGEFQKIFQFGKEGAWVSPRTITVFGILPIFFFFGATQTANYVKILQNSQNLTTVVGLPSKTQQTLQKTVWLPESKMMSGTYQFQDHLLRFPDYISKIFVVWGLLYVWKGVRPQRKMFKDGGNTSTRIIWPNQLSGGLRRVLGTNNTFVGGFFGKFLTQSQTRSGITQELKGLTAFRPILETLIQSFKTTPSFSSKFVLGQPFLVGDSTQNRVSFSSKSYAPKGYLFVGPPGTGKTLLAQAIAREANVPLLCVSASEIQKQIEIGTRIGALRLRKLFDQARRMAPCILFLDEIDAIGRSRGNEDRKDDFSLNKNEPTRGAQTSQGDLKLFTEFLIQMDSSKGPGNSGGFVVIGTTNFLSSLDSAFIRSGRFDRILGLNYPAKQVRIEILQWYSLKGSPALKANQNIPWNYFGYFTEGFSPADLARLVNESLLSQCKQKVSQKHTFESLQKGFNRIQTHKKYLHS